MFLSNDSIVLYYAVESPVESIPFPTHVELNRRFIPLIGQRFGEFTQGLIDFEFNSMDGFIRENSNGVQKVKDNRLTFLSTEEMIFIFHTYIGIPLFSKSIQI